MRIPSIPTPSFTAVLLFTLFVSDTSHAQVKMPDRPSSSVNVKIRWEYRGLKGPLEIYEAVPGKTPGLWSMGSAKSIGELPVGKLIPNSDVRMRPGESKTFVLVLKNPGSSPLYFFAAPHALNPPELSLGFKFHCLCINHIFAAPAGQYWYRVVQMDLMNSFFGEEITVTHTLIADPSLLERSKHQH